VQPPLFKIKKIMIKYLPRYSDTNKPDKMGRWARIAIYKDIRIASINMIKLKCKVVFNAYCHFPTMQNDIANEHKACNSLDEAKNFIKERWEWFLKTTS
jgi:hypothetical protein